MTGYLQRLAVSASRPADAVHPVLGSVFSPHDDSQGISSFGLDDDTAASVQRAPATLIPPARPQAESWQTSSRSGVSRDFEPAYMRSSSDSPTIDPTPPSRDDAGRRDSFRPLLPDLKHEVLPTPTNPGQESLLAEHKPSLQPAYSPLVQSGFAPRFAGTQTVANSSSFRGHETRATTGRSANSEPDEIQIHIGRIEVTAVPHTAPRTASKPARKGKTLEEYLKGRDRRA